MSDFATSHHLDHLKRIPLFSDLDEDSLGRISDEITVSDAPAGTVLMQQDQPGSGLIIIEEGTAVVERPGHPPIEVGPGEFLGDLALLVPEGTHRARVRAGTDLRFLAISRPDFARILEQEPGIAVAMLPMLARRLASVLGE